MRRSCVSSIALLVLAVAACDNSASSKPAPSAPDPAPGVSPAAPAGAAPAAPAAAAPAAPVVNAAGKPVYDKLCAPCHGLDLKGYVADNAPSLVNPTFLESVTDEFLRASIIHGRPGTSMGAYGKARGGPIDDATLAQLVAYIRSHGSPAKPLAGVRTGDATRGAPLYNEYCKTCHGDATTRGQAIHLANRQFQADASDPFIRYAIEKGRPGTKMPAFGGAMKPQQLDDLVAYIRALGSGAAAESLLPEPTGKEPIVINPRGKDVAWTARAGRFVSVDDVAKAMAEGRKMIIIDARPVSDWRRVHIKGAIPIPYHEPAKLDAIPKDVAVVAYCACPHHLSGVVVDELKKRGHKRAYVLDEGVNVWHTRKYPVTAAAGVGIPAAEPAGAHDGHDHGHGHAH